MIAGKYSDGSFINLSEPAIYQPDGPAEGCKDFSLCFSR